MSHGAPRAASAGKGGVGTAANPPGGVKTVAVGASTGRGAHACKGEINYFLC
jgi:hypothetical protein